MSTVRTRTQVTVVRTGLANTASVQAAVERAGASVRVTDDPADMVRASFVILPGVGSYGAAANSLQSPLRNALRRRVEANRPTLAICLGMQLFGTGSEEAPRARGLGLIPTPALRLTDVERLPAMGWSQVTPDAESRLIKPGWAYFAHSYALLEAPGPWAIARAAHTNAIAAVEHGNVLACQFHPELSGSYGAELLSGWIQQGEQS